MELPPKGAAVDDEMQRNIPNNNIIAATKLCDWKGGSSKQSRKPRRTLTDPINSSRIIQIHMKTHQNTAMRMPISLSKFFY
jgi:hypothetical protein